MSPEQRKERIRKLWGKVRIAVLARGFTSRIKKKIHMTAFEEAFEEVDYEFSVVDADDFETSENKLPWYLIPMQSSKLKAWQVLMSLLACESLVTSSVFLVFPNLFTTTVRYWIGLFDCIWIFDMLLSFLKAPEFLKK